MGKLGRGLFVLLLAGLLALTAGCGQEEVPGPGGEAGGYVEEKLELPLKMFRANFSWEGWTVCVTDGEGHCLKSVDGGRTFTEEYGAESVSGWKYISEAVQAPGEAGSESADSKGAGTGTEGSESTDSKEEGFGETGSLSADSKGEGFREAGSLGADSKGEGFDEAGSTGQTSGGAGFRGSRLLVGAVEGGGYEAALETVDGEVVLLSGLETGSYPKPFYGGGFFYLQQGSRIYQIDPKDGELRLLLENRGGGSFLAADGALLYVADGEGVLLYDLEKGCAAREDEVLSDFAKGNIRMTETGGYFGLLCPYGEGVYLAVQEGLYWHELYGENVELLIGGDQCRAGDVGLDGLGFQGMAADEGGLLVAYSDGEIMRYTKGGALPAQEGDVFRVYSLYRDSDIQKLVKLFQEKHPELQIKYEAGMSAGNGMTREDALKNLSTEMASGRGPDILVMDELPYESYAGKGALLDLTEIRGKMEEGEYFTKVVDAFLEEGKLYAVPLLFSIPVLTGSGEALAEAGRPETLAGLADLLEEADKGQESLLYNFSNGENLLCLLAMSCQGAWIGEDGTLDREAVREFLTQAERIYGLQKDRKSGLPEGVDAAFLEELGRKSGGNALERRFGDCGIMSLTDKAGYFPGQAFSMNAWNGCGKAFMEFVGYADYLGDDYCLMPGQAYGTCLPQALLAVNSASRHQDIGAAFLEYALSEEFQTLDSLGGTPVNRKAYAAQKASPRAEGEACGHATSGGIVTTVSFWLYWPGEEDFGKLDAMLDSITGINMCDWQVYDAVVEVGQSVLTGETGVEEAVEEIAGRVRLYLAE